MSGQKEITRADLVTIIQLLDKQLEGVTPLTAIGGTALTLLGMKVSSGDVDFILEKDDNLLRTIVTVELYKLGCETQIQERGTIVATALPRDYLRRAVEDKELSEMLQHIQLRMLSPLDVILTKLARFDPKDIVDITNILKTMRFPFGQIEKRFQQYLKLYPVKRKQEYVEKFERLRKLYDDVLN